MKKKQCPLSQLLSRMDQEVLVKQISQVLRPEIKKYELNLLTYRNILVRKLKGCLESKLHSLFLGAVHDRASGSNIKQTFPIKIRASQADSAEETVTHQPPCTV